MIRNTLILLSVFGICLQANAQKSNVNIKLMPKVWLIKVDPLSAAFYEFRASGEIRMNGSSKLANHTFFYISPTLIRRSSMLFMQKQFGGGIRAGIRMYFFTDYPPKGFFAQFAGAYQVVHVQNLSSQLEISNRFFYHSPGGNVSVGYQWMYGIRKNFVYGFVGGAEFFYRIMPKGIPSKSLMLNWNQMPFLPELRIYAGFEIGFAFRQRALHW